ncbi:STM4015 family protein [Nocardiopsis synnemataformans]|uniref:STM4015 family protein n=1 Tax=Nocardiopsis synnemataformans TaxID=61305 RepID=UPI003EBF2B01
MADLTEFAGLPVVEFPFDEDKEIREGWEGWRREFRRIQESAGDPSAASAAWRLRMGGEDSDGDEGEEAAYFARFLAEVDAGQVRALIIGDWFDSGEGGLYEAVDLLVEHADALPNLRSVFVGDISVDECELSWINQPDMAPLLAAFPRLEELTVKGAASVLGGVLGLRVPSHTCLRSLTVRSGGLPGQVARGVASSGLPALEHLELWLGMKDYYGDTSPEDLAPVLSGEAFSGLRYLGVRNAEKVDEWIPVLAEAPVTERVEVLDLSLGVLTDKGGQALLDRADAFAGLRGLDLHHHYLSEEMEERVRAAFAGSGVEVDLSERLEPSYFPGYGENAEGYWKYYTAAAE